jgi:hypothetical protein
VSQSAAERGARAHRFQRVADDTSEWISEHSGVKGIDPQLASFRNRRFAGTMGALPVPNNNVRYRSAVGLPSPRFTVNTTPSIADNPQSLEKARRADGNVPLQFFSEDAAANEEGEKIIKEFYRRVRFSANDRSVPASDQQ